ncbi:hypothetical protein IC235_21300 [Hymenobacter sp. BT664]|uniref:Heavy metal binding domain-containing protein n=1 Tax=Hymenobacter montanus TaxID=2771359 RepID=A0A927BHN7_9BACT|nr:heavy metal-binding domain-containing protein [Hymenobacter montanus]MBD2770430.1 hypothetical protein [Hymenobacter montanus]
MLFRFRFFLCAALVGSGLMLNSCGEQKPATATSAAPAEASKPGAAPAVEARYECPMGCAGSQSTKPGKCPVCSMELEKKS